jgi:DNA-binding response OmpR family regulator
VTVLVVEDDDIIREGLQISLRQDGYEVLTAATEKEAMNTISQNPAIDFFLLDVMLPDGDGYTICREIRKKTDVPILFLTACDDEVHTVLALEQGADDYIAKPFRIRELLARMKAILRRTGKDVMQQSTIVIGDNELDIQAGKVYRNQKNIELTAMEYRLLLIFVNHRGQTLSRQQLLNDIWDEAGDFVNDNTLTVYIKRLREKLGDFEGHPIIQTVRGIGYRMEK